jgi:hypothetical protein
MSREGEPMRDGGRPAVASARWCAGVAVALLAAASGAADFRARIADGAPSTAPASGLPEPLAPAAAGRGTQAPSTVFTLPGKFLVCSDQNYNWRYNMRFAAVHEFRQLFIDFDVYISNWDPTNPKGYHNIMWLNKGTKWSDMFANFNLLGTRNRTSFEVNYGGEIWHQFYSYVETGKSYHVRYEYDLVNQFVRFEVTRDGAPVTGWSYPRTGTTFSTSHHFIEFGTQYNDLGVDAKTYGWEFSNFRGEFVP